MERQAVESSSLASVGYDPVRRVLEVEFRESGDVYEYDGVPPATVEALLGADSLGAFFNASIRNAFPYRRTRSGRG